MANSTERKGLIDEFAVRKGLIDEFAVRLLQYVFHIFICLYKLAEIASL